MRRAVAVALLALLAMLAGASPGLAQGGYSTARAKAYAAASDWAGLLAYAQAWTRAAPQDPEAWYALGRANGSKLYRIGLQRPADALPAYRQAVGLRAQWPEAWYALGMTAQELGRFDESIEAIGNATKQAPGRANYWMSLAASYSHQRKVEPAVQAVGQAERLARTSQDWFVVGNSWYALGDGNHHMPAFQKAEAAYRHSLQLDGRVGRVWTNLGTAEEAQGKRAAALEDYQQGARLGDAEGTRHHARLTAAIAASQAAAQSARTTAPTTPYQCSQLSTADRLHWAATCTAIERRGY